MESRGEGRGRPGRGGERGGRDRRPPRERDPEESRGPRVPLPPAGPLPEQPPEPVGPFPEAFEQLGLSARVLAGIRDMGYATPTTIQEKGIPLALAGRDLVGASQTGTGKTAAFGLPILTKLEAPQHAPRVLILEPTRELASQVVEAFDKFNQYTGLRTVAVYGGVGYEKQRRALHEGVDVIVATPGRLLDFLGDGTISLASVRYLVLDEVDRMLDMGFLPDVRRIVDHCPDQRQTAFFSATMPAQIKTLANWALKEPVEVEVGIRFSPAETVSHYFYPVAADQREQLLLALLDQTDWHSVMIFTRTKMQADRIYGVLSSRTDHKVAVMHSDIAQRDREKALSGFREGTFEAIVATDLAARGLDISGVSHVINYQVPENPEDYVHRIGRTGRAQKEGDAFTLLSADELEAAESIERLIGQKIERRQLADFEYEYTALLDPQAGSAEKFKKLYRSAKPGGKKRR
jgi:ATP-dependent RNA helicase RhlE